MIVIEFIGIDCFLLKSMYTLHSLEANFVVVNPNVSVYVRCLCGHQVFI